MAEEKEHLMAGLAGLARAEIVGDVNEDPYPALPKVHPSSPQSVQFRYVLVCE